MVNTGEPVVIAISQITRIDPRGQAVPMMRVEYKIGPDGPFSLELPKSEFTAIEVKRIISEEASEVRQLYT